MTYFYEADCGSETINPKKDPPVSIYKKMLAVLKTRLKMANSEPSSHLHRRIALP